MDITPTEKQQKWQAVLDAFQKANEVSRSIGGLNTSTKTIRLNLGKAVEKAIVEYLVASGLPLKPASEQLDMVDKIDVTMTLDGQTYLGQVKFREEQYPDVGIEVFRPFAGLHHPRTQPGRDSKSRYDFYIILIKDTIYIVWGKAQKKLIRDTVREWEEDEQPKPWKSTAGVNFKFTTDRGYDDGGDSKLMAYIPPMLLVTQRVAIAYNEALASRPAYKDGLFTIFTDVLKVWKKLSEEE